MTCVPDCCPDYAVEGGIDTSNNAEECHPQLAEMIGAAEAWGSRCYGTETRALAVTGPEQRGDGATMRKVYLYFVRALEALRGETEPVVCTVILERDGTLSCLCEEPR